MKIADWSPQARLIGFLVALAFAVLCAVLLWWLVIGGPKKARQEAAQSNTNAVVAEGGAAAGKDAVAVVSGQSGRQAAREAVTRENDNAIRSAPGAGDPISPELHAAGLRALCLRDSYRGSAACEQLFQPDP